MLQYAIDEAVRKDAADLDAFVDAARTHGFGMWKLDCRSVPSPAHMSLVLSRHTSIRLQ